MQCGTPHWVSTVQLPLVRASNSPSKLSIAQSRTHILRSPNGYVDDGDEGESPSEALPFPPQAKSITSTSNPFVKHCVKLRLSSSYRHSHGSVLVVGTTPIREIFKFQESTQEGPATVDGLFLLNEAEIPEGLDNLTVHRIRVNSVVMKKLSGLQSTESMEVIALIKIPKTFLNLDDNWQEADCHRWFASLHRILVLDGIQDPGNLGALLRSALAFRWDGVFLLPGCCDPFNEKALRASRGASFQLPIVSGCWIHLEALRTVFQMKILAGHPSNHEQSKSVSWLSQGLADSLADIPLCLVLGSEGSGLSDKTRQVSDLVSIPMSGHFESLNVSVAGGIFLYALQPSPCDS